MAKSRKKTLSQQVVNTAMIGMPQPAKKFLGSRIISLFIVILIPVLIGTGMVTIRWENGRPRFSVNRERTAEARQEATEKLEEFRENHGDNRRAALADHVPQLGAQAEKLRDKLTDGQRDDQIAERVSPQLGNAEDKLVGEGNSEWNAQPAQGRQTSKDKHAMRPLHDVGQKVKGLFRK